jgi:hypothetical protein
MLNTEKSTEKLSLLCHLARPLGSVRSASELRVEQRFGALVPRHFLIRASTTFIASHHPSSLLDHPPTSRPPVKDNPALTASYYTSPSPTPFPPFGFWTKTINSSRDDATLVYLFYSFI